LGDEFEYLVKKQTQYQLITKMSLRHAVASTLAVRCHPKWTVAHKTTKAQLRPTTGRSMFWARPRGLTQVWPGLILTPVWST